MMKMKRAMVLAMILVVAVMALNGCGLFSSGDKTEDGSGEGDGTAAVKITDSFSFENPKDLEFDKRYVLYGGADSMLVSSMAEYGIKECYTIIYAKDDQLAGSYDFYIFENTDRMQEVIDLYAQTGGIMTISQEDDKVLYCGTDKDLLEAALATYQTSGLIQEATAEAYVGFYKTSFGVTSIE